MFKMKEKGKISLKEEWRDKEIDELLKKRKTTQTYRVPINWSLASYKLDKEKGVLRFGQGKRKMFLGFCMATEHLIKMEPSDGLGIMSALLIRDTYVETKNGKPVSCEEERRCLNVDCPVNHTTKESFVLLSGISEKTAKKMSWEAITSYRKIKWKE